MRTVPHTIGYNPSWDEEARAGAHPEEDVAQDGGNVEDGDREGINLAILVASVARARRFSGSMDTPRTTRYQWPRTRVAA